jgi:hypothetical protein
MLKAGNEQRMTIFDGLRIRNAARGASLHDVKTLTRAYRWDQALVGRDIVKPAPSNASLALHPRPDLRLAPGSIDLEVGIWVSLGRRLIRGTYDDSCTHPLYGCRAVCAVRSLARLRSRDCQVQLPAIHRVNSIAFSFLSSGAQCSLEEIP